MRVTSFYREERGRGPLRYGIELPIIIGPPRSIRRVSANEIEQPISAGRARYLINDVIVPRWLWIFIGKVIG